MLSRSRSATGIDPGRHSIKLVRVEQSPGGALRVTHWGLEAVADHAADARARSEALRALLKRLDLKPRHLGRVASSISGAEVSVRQASIPGLSAAELRRALPFEARKHLPLDGMKEPVLDYQVLTDSGRNGSDLDVILAAAPRTKRDQALELLRGARIDPDVLDVEPLPAVNAVLRAYPAVAEREEPTAILDLGAVSSVLAAVQRGGELYTRQLEFRNDTAVSAASGPRELPTGVAAQLTGELRGTLRFLSMRYRRQAVKEIYLCGGEAFYCDVKEVLGTGLGASVVCTDPFLGMEMASGVEPAIEDRVRLVSATGLACWWGNGNV